LDVELILPPTADYETLNLNIPASAQVNMDKVDVKKININQRINTIPMPMVTRGPKKPAPTPTPGKPIPLPTAEVQEEQAGENQEGRHKRHHKHHGHHHKRHHEHSHHGHGIHRRILHWGRKKFGCNKKNQRLDARFVELFGPKFINLTKTSSSQMNIKTHQKVILKDFSCSKGKLEITALSVNATRIDACESIKITARGQNLNGITAEKLEVIGNDEYSNLSMQQLNVKHVVGKLIGGTMKMNASPSSIIDLEKKGGELNVNLPGIVWFRNTENIKQGKWKCDNECTHDVKVTVTNKGSVQIVE